MARKKGGRGRGKSGAVKPEVKPSPSTSRNEIVEAPQRKMKNVTSSESKLKKTPASTEALPLTRMRTRSSAVIDSEHGQEFSQNSPLPPGPPSVSKQSGRKRRSVRSPVQEKHKLTGEDHGRSVNRKGHGGTRKLPTQSVTPGTSKKVLSRAELIQLESERIPSIKTSTWNPFTLFPKEVWELIFRNLTNSKDIENIMNSTPEWRQMYLSKRHILLCQQVITIMAENESFGCYHFLEQEDYFNCRLVCRSWDQSVQNYIQYHPVHFKLDDLVDEDDLANRKGDWLEDSLEEMALTHPPTRNPFLCRQITLRDHFLTPSCCHGDEDESPDFATSQHMWSTVDSLMEKYGRHVWHCTMDYSHNLTPVTWYGRVQHWISLMPNLKVLNLQYNSEYAKIGRKDLRKVDNQIAISTISSMEELIFLQVEDVPSPVFNELVRRSPKLSKIQIKLSGENSVTRLCHYNLNILSHHQLTEAFLTLVAPEDFRHLELTLPSWPLKILYIHLEYEDKYKKTESYSRWPNWTGIFKMLGDKFGSTLTELKLRLPKASKEVDKNRILAENLSYRLNLPQLKKLRVVVPNLSSFDFLLPMKSTLEELCLIVDHREYVGSRNKDVADLKRKEILKFTGNFATLYETNVFEEFPKLKHIQQLILAAQIFIVGIMTFTNIFGI